MTKQGYINKGLVIKAMQATAAANGKPADFSTISRIADRLHRIESTLSRLACDACNYPVYDSAKQERLEKLAVQIIKKDLGAESYTQRDPRGFIIRMYLQDDTGRPWFNSWDGETVGLDW